MQATNTYIVSGFLGAGKTTFIQKMLREALADKKVALIENDFGEVSVDASLLKGQAEITEINAGCICCSLSGNFVQALQDLLVRTAPEVIIIEPSGVGKLSDVVAACEAEEIRQKICLKGRITVVDAKRGRMYLENFGDFFEDQVRHADRIVLSHMQGIETAPVLDMLLKLNPEANTASVPWEELEMLPFLGMAAEAKLLQPQGNGCEEGCHCHEHGEEHPHNHAAEEVFETLSLYPSVTYTLAGLRQKLEGLHNTERYGEVLRAKGFLRVENKMVKVQYVPGEAEMAPTDASSPVLNVIGRNLNKQALENLFTE